MDYKIQSIMTVSMVLLLMVIIGVSVGQMDTTITGAAVKPICDCIEDSDCNDFNPNTEDICMEKDSCQKAYCINK